MEKDNNKEVKNPANFLSEFEKKVDELIKKRFLSPKEIVILNEFRQTLLESGLYGHERYNHDGMEMIDCLTSNGDLPPFPTENSDTTIFELIPESLKANKTFNHVIKRLFQVKGKGRGAGELALILLFSNTIFSSVDDLLIRDLDDNNEIKIKKGEVKSGSGACFSPVIKEGNKHRVGDNALEKWFGGLNPLSSKKNEHDDCFAGMTTDEVKTKFKGFFDDLYPEKICTDFTDNIRLRWATHMAGNMHDVEYCKEYLGIELLRIYVKNKGIASIILPDEDNRLVFISNFEDKRFLSNTLKFNPVFSRGGDTNAVADGYVKIYLKKKSSNK